MRKRVLLAYKERKMKLKVCVTKIHSVEVLRNGVIAMNCDLIEDKPSTDRIIFLNKKCMKWLKEEGIFIFRLDCYKTIDWC